MAKTTAAKINGKTSSKTNTQSKTSKSKTVKESASRKTRQVPRRITHAKVQSQRKNIAKKLSTTQAAQATTGKGKVRGKARIKIETQKAKLARKFNYDLNYKELDLRKTPDLYRVGVGEQGVLLVEPYKSEILPLWRFKTPADATQSAKAIWNLFKSYRRQKDLVGMDMARKFLQMGFTRSRRYANHKSGQKYDAKGNVLPFANDAEKAESAEIFKKVWKEAEADPVYAKAKIEWKTRLG